jgi:hypothetical protein
MRLNSFLLLASLLPCAAAQSGISVPALGYAYDRGLGAIRTIRGTPGAALLGEVLDTGVDIASAAIAPSGKFALAISTAENDVRLVSWQTGAPSVVVLADAMKGPDCVVFSTSGRAAVLSDRQSGHIQLLLSLPDSPVLREIQAAGTPAAAAIAVADDGALAFAAADGVHFVGADLNPSSLPLPSDVAALAFSSSNALLAVTSAGNIFVAKNLAGGADIRQVYSGDGLTADPVAVQFSANESTAFVANQAGILASVDLSAGAADALSCQCAPTSLQPFGRVGLFRLTEISNRPVLLFDTTPNRARLWFVPADQGSAQ